MNFPSLITIPMGWDQRGFSAIEEFFGKVGSSGGAIFGPEIRNRDSLGEDPDRLLHELFVKVTPLFGNVMRRISGTRAPVDDSDLKRTVRLRFVDPGTIASRSTRIISEKLWLPNMLFPSPPSLGK
jgi:hypothetical protein